MLSSLYKQQSCKTVSFKSIYITFISYAFPYFRFLFSTTAPKPSLYLVINHICKPLTLVTLGLTMYVMKFQNPWKMTYEKQKDGLAVQWIFLLSAIPVILNYYSKGFTILIAMTWYASFLRAGALIPQSFIFCDYIKKDEPYDNYLFLWVVFRGGANLSRFAAASVFHATQKSMDSWIMFKYCFEIIFFCDCLYWNLEFSKKGKSLKAFAKRKFNLI
jgi:hypothetical protein